MARSSCVSGFADIDASLRYGAHHDTSSTVTPLTLEAAPALISLYQPPLLSTQAYPPDTFYSSSSHLLPSVDSRSRLGPNTSSAGMAHAPRSTALPHPTSTQISTRDLYQTATPSFGRPSERTPRSTFAPDLRRLPLSPASTSSAGCTGLTRMEAPKNSANVPPLGNLVTFGQLQYQDAQGTPITVDIFGSIDKGFFLSENEWTCYRRNYFSCVCSYTLSPHYPSTPVQLCLPGSGQTFTVLGYAMSISAVVADNDGHAIELVQHTPKRDKGPIARPEKVRLSPKQPPHHHPHSHASLMYGSHDRVYDSPYSQPQSGQFPTEHTFERIQFKQATANNGKRRAAQQYYHLCIELWADIGQQAPEQFIKVAYRKSAKMIVRGRSPGHYQTERRGSTSSGPSNGGAGSYGTTQQQLDYANSSGQLLQPYPGSGYDPSRSQYGSGARHHHHHLTEPDMSAEDKDHLTHAKGYRYYPVPIYEDRTNGVVEAYPHGNAHDSITPAMVGGSDSKVKMDPEHASAAGLYLSAGPAYYTKPLGRFEGKTTSSGYYPTAMSASSMMT